MTDRVTSTTLRHAGLSAWCPMCRAARPCSPRRDVDAHGYRCDICQQDTHQPVIRLARLPLDEASPAA